MPEEMAGVEGLRHGIHATTPNVAMHHSVENPCNGGNLKFGEVSILRHQHSDSSTSEPKKTSVFDRITENRVDLRLQFNDGDKAKYPSIVGSNESSVLKFFPLKDKAQSKVTIPIDQAKEAIKTHHTTMYGYFLGPKLDFPVVHRAVKVAWGKFGFNDVMMNENGTYFFKFNDVGGRDQVMEAGLLMIRGIPFFVFPWDPIKGLTKPMHSTCPLWVKLHNIPLVAFNQEGISRIVSALGVPKQMDACTMPMCDNTWGRPSYEKDLVEMWAVGELKRELEVVIPNMNGGEDARVTIKYAWEPVQCKHLLVFGHKTSTCVKAATNQQL